MKRFFLAVMATFLFATGATALTVERSSAGLAGVSGWAPVLRLSNGDVIGMSGVSYAVPITAYIPVNVLMYEQSATAWVNANYGQVDAAYGANGGGSTWVDFNNNSIIDPGEDVQGGGSW